MVSKSRFLGCVATAVAVLALSGCDFLSFSRIPGVQSGAQNGTQNGTQGGSQNLSVRPPTGPYITGSNRVGPEAGGYQSGESASLPVRPLTGARVYTPENSAAAPPPPGTLVSTPVDFSQLPGWSLDRVERALPAFKKSCVKLTAKRDTDFIGKTQLGGRAAGWKRVCAALEAERPQTREQAQAFFTAHFQPRMIAGSGVFTGYYEPVLNGSLTRKAGYGHPIYLKPEQAASWMKFKGTGPDRRTLETVWASGLRPLVWLQDPVDVFMLQVQGSGLIQLDTGKRVRVSYAGDNGLPYKSVYPAMADAGFGAESAKSLQSMTKWLKDNPVPATGIMHTNPRFIFFRAHASGGAVGAEGVTLTAGRSMAVDPSHIPLGVPLWLDTKAFYRGKMLPVQRLMVAQDVGSAIKGAVRGDVFWGTGDQALEIAGNMKEPGRYYILLPKDPSRFARR